MGISPWPQLLPQAILDARQELSAHLQPSRAQVGAYVESLCCSGVKACEPLTRDWGVSCAHRCSVTSHSLRFSGLAFAVAPPDYLNWRQESVQPLASTDCTHRSVSSAWGNAGRWIRSSASLVTSVRCASGSACQAWHGALDCPFRAEMVSVRATVTYLACAALARYADAAQACVAGSQQQRLL